MRTQVFTNEGVQIFASYEKLNQTKNTFHFFLTFLNVQFLKLYTFLMVIYYPPFHGSDKMLLFNTPPPLHPRPSPTLPQFSCLIKNSLTHKRHPDAYRRHSDACRRRLDARMTRILTHGRQKGISTFPFSTLSTHFYAIHNFGLVILRKAIF